MILLVIDENKPPFCLDYRKTVIAQYANSPTLLKVISNFSNAIKICKFFNKFYKKIWDLKTADK